MAEEMRIDPITGKRVPVRKPVTIDLVANEKLPQEVMVAEGARVMTELAALRQEWVSMGPSNRCSHKGSAALKRYRKLAIEHWALTGKHPDPIYAEL